MDVTSKRKSPKGPDVIYSFLPKKIIESEKSPSFSYSRHILMCADISGFTSMSERLSEMGREGSEEITRVINIFFQPLIDIITGHGGDIVYFGGDAITAVFDEKCPGEALQAAAEATEFVNENRNVKTSKGIFTIGIHTALNAEKLFFQDTGKTYVLAGNACFRVIELLDEASAGEIVMSGEMAALSGAVNLQETGKGCFRVADADGLRRNDKKESGQIYSKKRIGREDAAKYLPDWLVKQTERNKGFDQSDGEHRKAAVVFMHFKKIPYDEEPEKAAETISSLTESLIKSASKYKGWINKIDFYKDGIRALIIFGVHQKLDNDEKHAILFADEMFRNRELSAISMSAGINSGGIFKTPVGSARRMEMTVMGDTVNTAARIAAKSEDRKINVGERVFKKTNSIFQYGKGASKQMKGKRGGVSVYVVEGMKAEGDVAEWLSESRRLIGNKKLLQDFNETQNECLNGKTSVFTIEGEAGMGKSRIVREVRGELVKNNFEIFEGSCLSYGNALAYHPWAEILGKMFRVHHSDSDEEKKRKILSEVTSINPSLKMWLPLIGDMMNVEFGSNDIVKNLENSLKMQKIFDITEEILRKRSETKPLCIIIEDYHWADKSSAELLTYLIEKLKKSRLMFFCAFRPTAQSENLKKAERLHEHRLKELNEQETKELIEDLLDVKELPDKIRNLITEKSQGNPFYVEELVKSLIESGRIVRDSKEGWIFSGNQGDVVLPDSVEDIILSRIDRLESTDKEVLQAASILGREFEGRILKKLCGKSHNVEASMEKLKNLDLIKVEEENDEKFAFKHIMTCETAYNTISFAKRRSMHSLIGRIFEGRGRRRRNAGLLSYHFMKAEENEKAAAYSIEAGERAKSVYANDEAIEYFSRAIAASEERENLLAQAAKAYVERASVYSFLGKGNEAEKDSYSSIDIARRLRDDFLLAECYIEMSIVYELMSMFDKMKETAEKALEIYQRIEDIFGMAKSYNYIGMYYGISGKPDTEKEYLEKTIELLNAKVGEETSLYNQGRKRKRKKYVSTLSAALLGTAENNLGYVYRLLGDLDTALEHYRVSFKIRKDIGERIGEAQSLNNIGMVFGRRGKMEKALQCFNKSVDIYEEIGNKKGLGSTLVNIGFLNGKIGRKDKEIEVYLRALEIQQEIGDKYVMSYTLTNIGKFYFESGQFEKSLENHKRALNIREEINDRSGIGNSFYYIAQAYGAVKETRLQIENYQKALEIYEEVKDFKSMKIMLPELAEAYEKVNDAENALKYKRMLDEFDEKQEGKQR